MIHWPWLALIAGGMLVAWAIWLAADIYAYSFASDPMPADAAIVLGAAIWNGQPSPVLQERIRHAIQLYQAKQVRIINDFPPS